MKDEALNQMLAEIEKEIEAHPIRHKISIYKWIVCSYIQYYRNVYRKTHKAIHIAQNNLTNQITFGNIIHYM